MSLLCSKPFNGFPSQSESKTLYSGPQGTRHSSLCSSDLFLSILLFVHSALCPGRTAGPWTSRVHSLFCPPRTIFLLDNLMAHPTLHPKQVIASMSSFIKILPTPLPFKITLHPSAFLLFFFLLSQCFSTALYIIPYIFFFFVLCLPPLELKLHDSSCCLLCSFYISRT